MRVDCILNILFQIIDCSSKESFMNPVFYSDERTTYSMLGTKKKWPYKTGDLLKRG
jgi:hypothetical protein